MGRRWGEFRQWMNGEMVVLLGGFGVIRPVPGDPRGGLRTWEDASYVVVPVVACMRSEGESERDKHCRSDGYGGAPCVPGCPLVGPESACAGFGLNSKHKHILRAPAQAALLVWALLVVCSVWAENPADTNLWERVEQGSPRRVQGEAWVRPNAFKSFDLHHARLRPLLGRAPKESSRAVASSEAVISLPLADGTLAQFRFVESPVMHPALAARFPEI